MPVFDTYLMVDWSAAGEPRTGADSIWFCELGRDGAALIERLSNPPTRQLATGLLADRLSDLVARGRRVLVGFDFAFGYPSGFAAKIGARDWRGVWNRLAARITDGPDNANNRFDAAAALNAALSGRAFPFWGHPGARDYDMLSARRPEGFGRELPELRLCERRVVGPQPTWKLCYAGAVGGQTLVGLPRLLQLRQHAWLAEQTRVWPFETGLRPLGRDEDWRVLLAEVYPSMATFTVPEGSVRDAQQVSALARHFAQLDLDDRLAALFVGDPGLSEAERGVVEREEGWILGVTGQAVAPQDYLRDPDAIDEASWAVVRAECDLSRIPAELRPLAMRVVQACGMTDVVDDLLFSPGAATAGRRALALGAPVLVDSELVAHGISRRLLPARNKVVCTHTEARAQPLARSLGSTRAAAALELWRPHLDGAVVAIGHSPTALFRLLEMVAEGDGKPAVVLGFAVGLVGAAESKEALAANTLGIPYVTLRGRRGGSAMAAAAVDALAGGLP